MTKIDLLRRTPVRLAGAFTILFTVTVLALFAVLYESLEAGLENGIRKRVEQTSQTLVDLDAEFGFDALAEVVDAEAKSVRDFDSIFLLRHTDGTARAGNVRSVNHFAGWGILDRALLPLVAGKGNPTDRFYAVWIPVSQGNLLVGGSDREIREVQVILLQGFGWGLGITLVLAISFAAFLARGAQHRIAQFTTTFWRVSRGDISCRVPLTGSADDLDNVAAQVNATLAHLQKLIENVNQASSDIAHDLKKPIGRLRRHLEAALHSARDIEDFQSRVMGALKELDSIVDTFEALLRITQIEAGARRARFCDVDLHALLTDAAEVYGPVAEESGDRLEFSAPRNRVSVIHGDRELLTQLFANLIENSIRHTPRGTRIGLDVRSDDLRQVVATVWDTGPGIPTHEHDNVFRRLYRLEAARSTAGSGLGLSLVAAIAELHGATVKLAENRPGLRVNVAFPSAAHSTEMKDIWAA